ncbi:MAG: hypothetical protein K2M08_07860 [Anaeroplasmataceae bacterium]|nr:hypothetical protein [Anaeroplasmataceae bacterium]
MWIWLLILAALLIGYFVLYKKFATLPDNSIVMVNGGLGAGKSLFTIGGGVREYKRRLRSWKISKVLFAWKKFEKPVICSNIPLKMDYVPLTKDILERKVRLPYGSVVVIDEFSLVADSMSYKEINNTTLMLFIKLFRQETRGGIMFVNTQALSDCHYAMKRCVNSYIWIFKRVRIFFLLLFKIRVFTINDESTLNVVDDVEDTRWYFLTKKVFKLYDTHCFSGLTDNLPVADQVINGKQLEDLKIHNYKDIASYVDYESEVGSNEKKKRK